MPPKKRGTRTRAALQAKQPVKQEQKEEGLACTKHANETSPDDKSRDTATTGPTLSDRRLRVRTIAVSVGGKQSSAKASKAKDTTAKGKKAGTKGKKMASRGVTRKRTKKAAASTADGRTDDGENEEAKVENIPPSKRRRNAKPIEDTDRVVFSQQPTAPPTEGVTTKQVRKKVLKKKEPLAVEMEDVSPVSHHSHSTVGGEVFVMGQGDMGQLGLGEDMVERKKPHPVGGALEGCVITQIICGGMHTVALSKEGKVYTWGCNDEGALGRSVEDGDEFIPGVVDKLEGVKVVQVSAGDSHTAALTDIGSIYCWGIFRDSNGAFGLVESSPSLAPQLLYSDPTNRAVKVASGSDHIAFLTEHGDISTFGCAEQGQLGRVPECFSTRGGRKGISLLLSPDVVRCRVKKGGGKSPKFSDIFCGPYHTFAVTQDGLVYVWGLNNYGQLCTGDVQSRYQPDKLKDDWIGGRGVGGDSFSVASGQHHTVVCCHGDVLTCGRNEYGRLGLGPDSEEPATPTLIQSLKGVKITSVEAGGSCSFAITATGDLYSWGMGTNLQLGSGEEDDVWTPAKVSGKKIENRKILSVSAGGQHTALLVEK